MITRVTSFLGQRSVYDYVRLELIAREFNPHDNQSYLANGTRPDFHHYWLMSERIAQPDYYPKIYTNRSSGSQVVILAPETQDRSQITIGMTTTLESMLRIYSSRGRANSHELTLPFGTGHATFIASGYWVDSPLSWVELLGITPFVPLFM